MVHVLWSIYSKEGDGKQLENLICIPIFGSCIETRIQRVKEVLIKEQDIEFIQREDVVNKDPEWLW